MKKKVIAVLLCATMALGMLSACGSSDAPAADDGNATADEGAGDADVVETADGGKQLVVQVGPDPETIDPALNSAVDGANMIIHTLETLLIMDENGELQPGQAETWEVSEDGLTYTFHLRDGLKWSDGSDLTANDFVFSWKRVCDPMVAAPYAETVLGMVEGYSEAAAGDLDALGVSAPDDKTFVVKLAYACPYFESLAAFATLSPVQQATVEANGDAWAIDASTYISNGCFYISEWVPGSHLIMTKNPYYWNADAVKLDSIKFLLMEDSNAAYSAYQTGEALMIKSVPADEIPSLVGNDDYHVDINLGTYYISLNDEIEPFNNAKVRKALSLAIDRDYVANTLMQGTYSPAYNFMGPGWSDPAGGEFMDNANGGQPYISEDFAANLEEAKKLLEEAGYPNGEGLPTLTYSTNDQGYHKAVAEYVQDAWKEIGVTVDVEVVEWSSFTPLRRNGDYEISRNGWVADYNDPSNMLELMYTTNGNNDGNYSSAEFDAAIDASRIALDPAERSAALHQAEDIMMEDAACIPLAYYSDFYLQSSKITGSWHSPYGYWYFMYADIAE